MKKLSQLCIALLCVFTFQNCDTDDFDSRTVPNFQSDEDIARDELFIAENFGAAITSDFFGIVEDQYGGKLSNAKVTIGNSVAFTDRNGVFSIENANVYEKFAYIKASKDGFINGSKTVIPSNGTNTVQLVMFKKEIIASVNSGEISSVALPNGANVQFTGGFVRQDGTAYNGQVDVVLHHIGENPGQTLLQMPGSLFGQSEDNSPRLLETFGMMSVNLFSPSGEQLNINEFNKATLEFPITTANAPDFIPLWYFDEERGFWKEEGQAEKLGNMYIAEVSHFSWWNCDLPLDYVELCLSLSVTNSTASIPYVVLIQRNSNNQMCFNGIIYANNTIECGRIPENEQVNIYVFKSFGSCEGGLVHQGVYGGFNSDTNLNVSFENTGLNTPTFVGMANDCNGSPITNGYMYIDDLNIFPITNGTINASMDACNDVGTVQIYDYDSDQWLILDNVDFTQNTINLGNIATCDNSGGIYNGNLVLSTQQEVNDFGSLNFSTIDGSLTIGSLINTTDITNLTALATIESVHGDLKISGNTNLPSLADLQNIQYVGNTVEIANNASLTSLAGFTNLTHIPSLIIKNNAQLTSILGFAAGTVLENELYILDNQNLTSLQGIEVFQLHQENSLKIQNNDVLTNLVGVEAISQLQFLDIKDNDALQTLTAFQSLTQVLDLSIVNNDALVTLVGLEQLVEMRMLIIGNNENLQNLNGLENLTTLTPGLFRAVNIGGIQWENFCSGYTDAPNPNLTDFCALQNLMPTINWGASDYTDCAVIVNNAYNPTPQDIINGNCSQ